MKRLSEILTILVVSLLVIGFGYLGMSTGKLVGFIVFGLGCIPFVAAILVRLAAKRMIPDMVFGVIDTGMLTIFALVGGHVFGVLGAVVGGVVGDAVTDGIAGFFEGGIARWLRAKGIEESRLPLSSGLGKMCGCLFGCGFVLIIATAFGVGVEGLEI